MLYFSKDAPRLAFAAPSAQLVALGAVFLLLGLGAEELSFGLHPSRPTCLMTPEPLSISARLSGALASLSWHSRP